MSLPDLADKQALVIDASDIVRSSVVKTLTELGLSRIKTSNVSARALQLVASNHYDIVLIGHDTSERKTGLHLLEEARYKNLIKASTIWGFMTSDLSSHTILHATENEPDFLIPKPFSTAALLKKLQIAFTKKKSVLPIVKALDNRDIKKALAYCDFALKKNFSPLVVKQTKVDLLLGNEQYQEALVLLQELTLQAPHQHLDLKICQALIGLKHYPKALDKIESVIQANPLLIKAHDLKAKIHEDNSEYAESMDALIQAVKLSSISIVRNLKLGQLALATGNLDVADSIYKRTIKLNPGSCHYSPTPYLGLANSKREQLKVTQDSLVIEQEIEQVLRSALTNFPDNPELKVKIALFRKQLQDDLNNHEKSAVYLQLAKKLVIDHNIQEDINELLEDALCLLKKPKIEETDKVVAQASAAKSKMSNKVNLQGIHQHLSNNPAQAIKYFTMSLELDKGNCTALLNLAQLYLESLHTDKDNQEKSLRLVQRYLSLTENLHKTAKQKKRYDKLMKFYAGGVELLPKGPLAVMLKSS